MSVTFEEVHNKVVDAIVEAKTIALDAKFNPNLYVVPRIEEWRKKYVALRFYGSDNPGYFDLLCDRVLEDIKAGTESAVSTPLRPFNRYELESEGTGESHGSDAALRQIAYVETVLAERQISVFFEGLSLAVRSKDASKLYTLFNDQGPRAWLLALQTLFNTLLKKMDQGARPAPVPGPDEELIQTPFGPSIVKKSLKTVGALTVSEFRQLMAEILGH